MRNDETSEIVVGLGDGLAAAAALRWGARHSQLTGFPLRIVHAWELPGGQVPANGAQFVEAATADARAWATSRVRRTLADMPMEIMWTLDIVQGSPGPALVARSRGGKLLVLGTGEHGGIHRVLAGSVSRYCLSHADGPVVVVPPPRQVAEPDTRRDMLSTPGPLL